MTVKQRNILEAALELFANEGYNAVSTSKIARKAGVSEGLIFRHFENKKGLLDANMQEAERRLQEVVAPILQEENPRTALAIVIDMPFEMEESEYDFWKLQYKLKWEAEYNKHEKMRPMMEKLTQIFEGLGFDKPTLEAQFFAQIVDSIFIGILRDGKASQEPLHAYLKEKYGV
ncbi:MAG: helix-turn-helix domain-containing protein [Bacteroidota bacterium]